MFQTLDTANAELKAAFGADETELECVGAGAVPLEVGLRDDLISDEILEERPGPPEEKERWAERDLKYDSAASGVAAEILRRSELMGDAYPFELSRGSLRYRGSSTLVYEFCLAVASAPKITEGAFVRLPRNFERLGQLPWRRTQAGTPGVWERRPITTILLVIRGISLAES